MYLCRCINVPKAGLFVKNNYYKWTYLIDGYRVWDSEGNRWDLGEIAFYIHFQIIKST